MKRFAIAAVTAVLALGACGADEAVDQAVDDARSRAGDAADALVADQLSGLIQANSSLGATDADCVAAEVVDRLGTGTVASLVIETGGDLSQVSEADAERVAAAVQAAGETCGVDAADAIGR